MLFLNCVNIFRSNIRNCIKMSSIERVKLNAETAKQAIQELKSELHSLNSEYNNIVAKELRAENARLLVAVEEARARLVELETKNGIQQIPVPNQSQSVGATAKVATTIQASKEEISKPKEAEKPTKEAKAKKEKKPKEPPTEEPPVDVGRLDLRIAKVEDVQKHPDADSLYVLKINCGEDKPRTVCSGLVKHVPIEDLRDRVVLLLCNLKPVKMRGITSEAMVMCASSEQGVEVLLPPSGCTPGEPVHCDGYTRKPDPVMNPKKKIFETVAPDLHTDASLRACYKGVPLVVPEKGPILAKTLANVPVK